MKCQTKCIYEFDFAVTSAGQAQLSAAITAMQQERCCHCGDICPASPARLSSAALRGTAREHGAAHAASLLHRRSAQAQRQRPALILSAGALL